MITKEKVLSVDHSFKRTGYAFFVDGELKETGTFSVGHMSYDNILLFEREIRKLFDKYRPTMVVTEKPAHMRNANIARMLSGLHLVLVLACMRHGIVITTVNPKSVKKAITGSGNATKQEVRDKLIEMGYNPELLNSSDKKNFDESDAVANGIIGIQEARNSNGDKSK